MTLEKWPSIEKDRTHGAGKVVVRQALSWPLVNASVNCCNIADGKGTQLAGK